MTIDSPSKAHESRLILLPNRQAINARWFSLALARGWDQPPARRLFSLEVTLQAGGPRCRPRRRALVEGRKRKEDLSMVSCVRNVMSERDVIGLDKILCTTAIRENVSHAARRQGTLGSSGMRGHRNEPWQHVDTPPAHRPVLDNVANGLDYIRGLAVYILRPWSVCDWLILSSAAALKRANERRRRRGAPTDLSNLREGGGSVWCSFALPQKQGRPQDELLRSC